MLTLRRTLLAYDPADLLAAIGALQLMPENAGRAARFEALAHVAASIPRELHRAGIKLNRLKSVLNSGPLANFEIVKDEDPHEFAFTESFAFIDGPFTVFPGIADDTTFMLQHLLKAIFRHRRQIDNQEYLDRAFQLTLAVLLLSDEIARRAGVEPGIDPVYARTGKPRRCPLPESPFTVEKCRGLSWGGTRRVVWTPGCSLLGVGRFNDSARRY